MTDHLLSRWFDTAKYPNVVVTDDIVFLPLYNMSGKVVGYQTYNPSQPKKEVGDYLKQKYCLWITRPAASKNGELAVWGLETVEWTDKILFLTEGVFDACRLHWHGLPAVAVLGNNPLPLCSWLDALPSKKVACVQGDKAGLNLAKFGDEKVWLPKDKDVGDLTEMEFAAYFGKYL